MNAFLLMAAISTSYPSHLPPAQVAEMPALYAIENVEKDGVFAIRNLVRISFGKDKLTREVLVTKEQRFFGHFGGHQIVGKRHVATHFGGVIDLQTNKVLHDQQFGELLGSENGKVVYRVTNTQKPNGIFAFDVQTHQLEKLKEPGHWSLPGVKSADNKMSVHQQFNGGPLNIHRLDGSLTPIGEGFRVTYQLIASPGSAGVPLLWIVDRQSVLTQRTNGALVTLDVQGKEEKLLDIAEENKGGLSLPRLYLDPKGRIIYAANHRYVIDIKMKTATKLIRASLGHGFEVSVDEDEKKLRTVFHEGKEIGRWNLVEYHARTAPGLIAFPYAEAGENLGYPKGVAVWSVKAGRWQTVDMAVNDLIGWVR